jgi:ABC-type transport system involved in multi-copper enzyme maturation permease subunit
MNRRMTCSPTYSTANGPRAFLYLILLIWQRQARAHLMVWIALGLLALSAFLVLVSTWNQRWNMSYYRVPGGGAATYADQVRALEMVGHLPWDSSSAAVHYLAWAAHRTMVYDGSGFFVFSNRIVFSIFTTFLLPLWTLSFATEGLGREREAGNLVWVLTRPLSRPAIYLAKFLALLPWCLSLNQGGFALLCLLAGPPGTLALQIYWPAVLVATLAFAALFHLLAALVRRASVLAILYVFFLETVAGNLPGHLKRLSLSFYTRCLMFDRAHDFGIQPERPHLYLPVSGAFALCVLAGMTIILLAAGTMVFSRKAYLDVT